MATAILRFGSDCVAPSYAAVETVLGGQFVEGRAGTAGVPAGGVGVAAANSTTWLGVAVVDAAPLGTVATSTPSTVGANPIINVAPVHATTPVARNCITSVVYAAAATFGQQLTLAAGGQVTPVTGATLPAAVVGRCEQPGGVAAGASGLTYVFG